MRELLRALQGWARRSFSSHILSEVADICTCVGIIEHADWWPPVAAEMIGGLRAHRAVSVRLVPGRDLAEAALPRDRPGSSAPHCRPTRLTTLVRPPTATRRLDFNGDEAALAPC
jgi:hypothetical protein